MLADVTNRAKGARVFSLAGGGTRCLEPGVSARLDLADHPSHDAWTAMGEAAIVVVPKEPAAMPEPHDSLPRTGDVGPAKPGRMRSSKLRKF